MIAILDTSSLLAFVRYYLPFDKNGTFKELIKTKLENGEIIILDKVVEESRYQSKGIILKILDFIESSKKAVNTKELLPPPKFFNLLENNFCDKSILKLKDIDTVGFEIEKAKYLKSADANLILYAMNIKDNNPIIVTEETLNSNDGKIFKKIPTNCKAIDIECCTLPQLFEFHYKLDISELLK
jgi:hypothetical protein